MNEFRKRNFERKIKDNFEHDFEDLASIENIKDEINN